MTPEAICDRLDEVTKDLLAVKYRSIMDSIGDLNFIMIERSDLMEHMSPVEGDGRLYLDFDRILVIGAEEFTIVDTMPLYTFHRPMAFFYGQLPEDMPFLPEDYDAPDSFPIALCSRYSRPCCTRPNPEWKDICVICPGQGHGWPFGTRSDSKLIT